MFIFRNALKNLSRNKGRNILVGVILLLVMTATTVSLTIRSASEAQIAHFQDSFGVESHFIVDWDYADEFTIVEEIVHDDGTEESHSNFAAPRISLEQYMAFADSEYVQSAVLAASTQFTSDDLEPVPIDESLRRIEGMTIEELLESYTVLGIETVEDLERFFARHGEDTLYNILNTRRDVVGVIWGYSDMSMMQEFRVGRRVIVDGRMVEAPGEVIIGESLAELNNLSVGDTFTITGPRYGDAGVIPLTVVGIFNDYQADLDAADVWMGVQASDIIVHFDTLHDSGFSFIFPVEGDIRFFLRDVDAIEPFLAELRDKGLHNVWTLYSDIAGYERIVEPVQRMSSVATTFGIVVLLTGAGLLIFLSIMNIRERKYEVGVLRAIGMKKKQLARGMIYESLSLVTICTLLGLPLGALLSEPVAGFLLDASGEMDIAVSFGAGILSLLLAVAVGLGVVSSLIGIAYIMRYEPMKILSEQN